MQEAALIAFETFSTFIKHLEVASICNSCRIWLCMVWQWNLSWLLSKHFHQRAEIGAVARFYAIYVLVETVVEPWVTRHHILPVQLSSRVDLVFLHQPDGVLGVWFAFRAHFRSELLLECAHSVQAVAAALERYGRCFVVALAFDVARSLLLIELPSGRLHLALV